MLVRKEVIELYKSYGIDVNKVLEKLKNIPISLHCWQMDDVNGFESDGNLTGGIQTTGNYLGKARNFDELTKDLEFALKYIPGKKKINLHAIYQAGDIVDRSEITYKEFLPWVDFAKKNNLGLDFNPTMFSSPMLVDNMTLSSPRKEVRDYWIKHCINSLKVTEYFGKELGEKALMNIWIPDGLKDTPADRLGPRMRLKDSLDKIIHGYNYDKSVMDVSVESKVFGIGMESYTVGSHEFYMNYAKENNLLCLLDTGHFHQGENVSDKISSMLLFNDKLALHVSRPVRWDSDHVLKLNDDLQEVADELVKCDGLERTYIALDYFDASINRVAALVIGARNMEKALLRSLLTPWDVIKQAQDEMDHTKVLALFEEIKTLPWNEVWDEYCKLNNCMNEHDWFNEVLKYEKEVLVKRG
ncbi:MAG: L-rhamnose isomerase [Bacilli bacterium]|nr:L-rhamnose isomerase [Bacilli bacterium]